MDIRPVPKTKDPALDGFNHDVRRNIISLEQIRECVFGWVDDDHLTVRLGDLPPCSYVVGAHIHVTEAFNSDAADNISVGWTSDTDALVTAEDVSATGVKALTMGANNGYNAAGQEVNAYYVAGGSAATTGKAIVIIEFIRTTKQVS